jgi:drug/metabolite transporter (DMT)-like permease
MKQQMRATLYGLSAVLLWSTVATAFKLSLRYLSPVELLFYSSGVSTLVIAAVLAMQRKFSLIFQCTRQQYLLSMLLGFLNPFLYYLILFKAYDLLPAQQAQPINYTWAITLSLLSVPLLKQKIRIQQWLALLISYCGVVVISTEGKPFSLNFTEPLGVALALLSTIIWALYWIYNTKDSRDPVVGLLINFAFGFICIFIYSLVTDALRVPPLAGLVGAVYVGFFEMGVCFVLWLMAMKLADNTAMISNLIFLSPFISLFFIHFFVGEQIVAGTYIGLVLIIGGLICQRIKLDRQKHE